MKTTNRMARYLIATAALGGAAILIPAMALAAPARPAAAPRPAAPKCSTGALRAWLGIPGDGFAGGTGYQLELSNISHQTCTLSGFPGVSAIGRTGHQTGTAAGRNHSHPARLIALAPGGTAHVVLQIADVGNFPASRCRPAKAVELRVFPPNDFSATRIPFSFRACGKRGPVFLTVTTALRGTGIPGFSS